MRVERVDQAAQALPVIGGQARLSGDLRGRLAQVIPEEALTVEGERECHECELERLPEASGGRGTVGLAEVPAGVAVILKK